jgi:uncharacterized protein (TIGR00369 family)
MDNPLNHTFTPFMAHLGAELVSVGQGKAEIQLLLKPHLENGLEAAHGGVVMTLLDVVMAMAAKSSDPNGFGVVTIEMKTSFLRPAKGTLHAHGLCDHHSASMAFCRGEIRDPSGRLIASSMGTFKRIDALRHRSRSD